MSDSKINLESVYNNLFLNKEFLTSEDKDKILEETSILEKRISQDLKRLMELGRLQDYENLLKQGFDHKSVIDFIYQDNETIAAAEKKLFEHLRLNRVMMFGYPANMSKDSSLVGYFRCLESQMYLMNSCGDAYNPGNYRMNNAETELAIIDEVKKNLGLDANKYWGYINSGGTEGNFWGLREGIFQFPDSVVYVSKDAHYSVAKFLEMVNRVEVEVVDVINGKINNEQLFEKINKNKDKAAILLLTLGTTALGSVDDIEFIKNRLSELNIPHYIHLDAAMYGGIPKNAKNSPNTGIVDKLNKLNIDSISISLHKYIGSHKVNGILLAQKQSINNYIDYIGQRDISILGSRDIAPFSTLQRIKELYNRTPSDEYYKNVEYFEKLLNKNDINYIKGHEFGNTFVIDKPSDSICKKFQLATFDFNGKLSAHIIVFPYHTHESMNELITEIKNDKK